MSIHLKITDIRIKMDYITTKILTSVMRKEEKTTVNEEK